MLEKLVFPPDMVAKYPVLQKFNDGERTFVSHPGESD